MDCSGEFVRVHGMRGDRPVQRPHPPIMNGGGGARILNLAGARPNIVSIPACLLAPTPTALIPSVAQHRIAFVRPRR